MAELSIISWNVRGLNSATKRTLVFKYLQKYNPCILQETHLIGRRVLGLQRAWVGVHHHSTYSNYARGVSILIRRSLPLQILDVKTDPGGRYVISNASLYDRGMVLVGLYLPPPAEAQLLNDIMQLVMGFNVPEVFIFGGFNMVPSQDLDRLHMVTRTTSALGGWADTFALTCGVTFTQIRENTRVTRHHIGHSHA